MTDDTLANALNRHCHCINVDQDLLRESLEARLGKAGAWSHLQESHPHLLADSPVFISHGQVRQMKELIEAIESVVSLETFQDHVLGWAPSIARHKAGAHGVFFGYDFHLTNDGPQLIEINTNAGGALLLLQVASAQQACCSEVEKFVTGRIDTTDLEHTFVEMFRDELRGQLPGRELLRVAVVDESPAEQYLSPEFTLFARMFEHHSIDAVVTGPEAFTLIDRQLLMDGQPVDLVYNRLTDFYLQSPACAVLNRACQDAAVVITPDPHTHAVYANKKNLTVLCDPERLRELGADAATIATLQQSLPKTELVTAENADALWAERKRLFFKPAWGFGSRGTYKGAKLTRKTWDSIVGADYIAQALVPPSERLIVHDGDEKALKLDVRCYTYKGEIQLLGARMYRGQTTNFRTDGGGLAAVFTAPGG